MDNNYTQAKRMNGHYLRADRFNPCTIKPQNTLPPRETFDGLPEVLEAYDLMTTLNASILEHSRAARDKRAKADQAAEDYKAKVREALNKSEDVTKIKDHTDRYKAEAEAHESFSKDAIGQATRQGITLGRLFAEVGPATFATSEKIMAERAEHVRAALASLTETWTEWNRAWGVRRYMSRAAHKGGQLVQFQKTTTVPKEIAAAVQAINNALAELDRLKDDEAELTRWRNQNSTA